jgi:predicted acylesterase/phospholipase RssA
VSDEPVQKPLQIALTLPGGASLGTFEAGAVCALLVTIQNVNAHEPGMVIVDRIAGASAGALSGVLAARVLLTGEDPLSAFSRAWVREPTLQGLRARGPWAPLTLRRARSIAQAIIARRDAVVAERRQEAAIEVEWALTSLRGADYDLARIDIGAGQRGALRCTSHIDWSRHCLRQVDPQAGEPDPEWARAVDGAIASASHPLAFAATLLDRKGRTDDYKANGVQITTPGSRRFWYTDGGLVNNEPLGRSLGRSLPDGDQRVVLVVRSDPRAAPPAEDDSWTGAVQPRWSETLARSVDVLCAHSVGENIRQAEKINRRVAWTMLAAQRVAPLIEVTEANLRALQDAYGKVESEQDQLRPPDRRHRRDDERGHREGPEAASEEAIAAALTDLLFKASGLEGKRQLDVAVVTNDPDKGAGSGPLVPKDIRLQLGGFLDRRRREFDFAAGYRQMLDSIGQELARQVDQRLLAQAVTEARARMPRPRATQRARRRAGRVSLANRIRLVGLSLRVGRIASGDAIAMRRNRRRRLLAAARARRTS